MKYWTNVYFDLLVALDEKVRDHQSYFKLFHFTKLLNRIKSSTF